MKDEEGLRKDTFGAFQYGSKIVWGRKGLEVRLRGELPFRISLGVSGKERGELIEKLLPELMVEKTESVTGGKLSQDLGLLAQVDNEIGNLSNP